MNPLKLILLAVLTINGTLLFAQSNPQTTFEQSGGTQTGTYVQVIDFYLSLAKTSPYVSVKEMGKTDSGFPLHVVLFDADQQFDPEAARKQGKTIVLFNNGIHPGEPDGIEASQMLLRNYALDKKMRKSLKGVLLVIIPIYNIGGALDRNSYSRANQNGPEAYGFRGNAQNYDLNRDFIKADSKNARAFQEIYQWLKPDLFIDTHVSNGADYQYAITHLATQHNKIGGAMGTYLHESFTPQLETKMAAKGSEITPYVNVFNTTPDSEGIIQFMDYPRYSTGYTALFNTLGFMIETHMLKPFDVRVKATYDFLESVLELAVTDGEKIQALHHGYQIAPGDTLFLDWKLDESHPQMIAFKGYEGEKIPSKVTGQERLFYNREKPFTRQIPYYCEFTGVDPVVVPTAYVVPQGWVEVIDRLLWSGVTYQRLAKDTVMLVERYRIAEYQTGKNPYEGHYAHSQTKVDPEKDTVTFRAGDYLFPVAQPGGRFLVETLEPQAPDSYFNWNFFDTRLQQKEHFSPYVFEDIAWELLQQDPQLKTAFEARKNEDAAFAKDGYAQLRYIYQHSPYYESAHLQYPVYRLAK